MTILRSLLFVPGNKSSMLTKALGLRPDAYVPDMEDSVPAAEKANARATIRDFLPQLAATGIPVIPRVNALETERIEDDSQVAYARQKLCVSARAAHVLALDTPYFKLRDPDGLRANALAAKSIGFKGKFAIHPDQVAALNECFSPSPQEIAHAERVVAAFAEAEARGRGSTSLDGWVIDVPVVKRARALLELARRARDEA